MKYLKLFESYESIEKLYRTCREYNIKNYSINLDLPIEIDAIDVDGSVDLHNNNFTKLPLKFNKVNGYFDCNRNKLTSLEGSPKEVNGNFSCSSNKLTSFEFAPRIIRDDFYCRWNNIKSFEYFPSYVKSGFYCEGNPIFEVWRLFRNTIKIELLNDFDIFRDEDTDTPAIVMNILNDFLEMIGNPTVKKVDRYKNI